MSRMPIRAMGVAWYKPEDYPRILEVMEDAHLLPPTYEKWKYSAYKLESQAQRQGTVIIRAMIDPDEFVAWCASNNLKVDAQARMRFASELAAAQVRQTH